MTTRASRPRGPRGAQADTRTDIVDAARELFIAGGFEGTSMRAIAKAAGVDPSLPRHYFPSKPALFVEAIAPIEYVDVAIGRVLEGPEDALGSRLVATFVTLWDSPELGGRLRTLITSAAASPEVAAAGRTILFERFFAHVARSVGPDDVEARAAAALSQLLGLALGRYVLQLAPLASATAEQLAAAYGPNVQRLITGTAARA